MERVGAEHCVDGATCFNYTCGPPAAPSPVMVHQFSLVYVEDFAVCM